MFWSDRLVHAVGAAHVRSAADSARVVVAPGAPAELVDVVRIAGEVGAGVIVGPQPRGAERSSEILGPSGAAGGAERSEVIELDLGRMANVLHLDETSLLVSVQVGITMAALEAQLAERGLTLGVLPAWSRDRTLGALLAAPRAAEASPRVGRFTQACGGIAGLLADGTEIQTRLAPRKATGPDLMHALVGARGTLGLITAATIRIHRRQEARLEASFRLPTLPAALSSARALLVRGGRPADLTVSPAGDRFSSGSPASILALQVDGPEPLVDAERALAEAVAREHGGEPIPFAPPPRVTTPPHERAVPLETVDAEVLAADLLGDALRIVGWHAGGACVVDRQRSPAPPGRPSPLWAALKRRLDPDRRFADWPGA